MLFLFLIVYTVFSHKAISLIGPTLLVIGLSGILVVTHIPMRIIVPAIPIAYQILSHLFIIGKTQKSYAIPSYKKKNSIVDIGIDRI